MEDPLVITDQATIRFLLDPKKRRLLKPFIGRSRTISEAAEQLAIDLKLMAYYTHRSVRLGLLEQVDEATGGSSKVFQLKARHILIPFSETRFDTFGTMLHDVSQMRQFTDHVARALQRFASDWSVVIGADADEDDFELAFSPVTEVGDPRPLPVSQLLDRAQPAFFSSGDTLRLDSVAAKELQRDLVELLTRYKQRSVDKGQAYALLLSLTSVSSNEDPL